MSDNFFNCLLKLIPINLKWKTERELKKFIGIEENDYLSTSYIGNIENALDKKYAINISGDQIRNSTIKSFFKINLLLKDKKYSVLNKIRKAKGIAYEEKEILVYDFKGKPDKVPCYAHGKRGSYNSKKLFENKSKPLDPKTIYIIIPYDPLKIKDKGIKRKETLKEYYNRIILEANALKKKQMELLIYIKQVE